MNLFVLTCLLGAATVKTEAVPSFIAANTLFTGSIYKELLGTHDGDFLVSPFSAEVILALVQRGAKDSTSEELHQVLHLPSDEKTEEDIHHLLDSLPVHNDTFTLRIANKLYLPSNFAVNRDFQRVAKVFGSAIDPIDFSNNDVASTINKWVEEQTENKIHNIVLPGTLAPTTSLFLINALYFRASWRTPFFPDFTSKLDFHRNEGDVIQVDAMRDELSLRRYAESLQAKFLEIPFKTIDDDAEGDDVDDSEASVIFVLPKNKHGLSQLENNIEKVFLKPQFEIQPVNVSLPKFKIESSLGLKDVLINLGVNKAFREGEADFGGISDNHLFISDVLQKTYVDLNEHGVEAAAVTTIAFGSYIGSPPGEKTFHADHPFIFYIQVKDVILFAGRVISPSYY